LSPVPLRSVAKFSRPARQRSRRSCWSSAASRPTSSLTMPTSPPCPPVLPGAAAMACAMSGQSCVLPSRILLPRSRYEEGLQIMKAAMEAMLVGDPWDPAGFQGPQIRKTQQEKVLGLIQAGIADGARLVTGGGVPPHLPKGYYVQPTILADVDQNSRVAQEEIFGPVLCVIAYDTEEEAIAIAHKP